MFTGLRYAFRQLRSAPAFTATVLLTLTLCLGANLSIFAVVDAVLLRALPFPQPEQLVSLYNTYPKAGLENDGASIANYYERRGQIPAFSSLSIYRETNEVIGQPGATEREATMRVSPEFFETLGLAPVLGRAFTDDETNHDHNDVVIITDAFWRTHFDRDPNVLGREVRANQIQRRVVGVLPPGFRFLSSEAQLFLPYTSDLAQRISTQRHSGGGATHMIARLRPGANLSEAQAQIDAQNAALEKDNPDAKMMAEAGFRTVVLPMHLDHVRAIRPTLLLLQAGALFLLLIGAINVINLLLIRASTRAKEMAIRQSMGASPSQLVRQILLETVSLTFLGGVLGLVAAAWGIGVLRVLGAQRLPLGAQIQFDARLAGWALLASVALGLFIALPVGWFNLRNPLASTLQIQSRASTSSTAARRLRHGFIVAQIALAFVLLSGAALLGLSLKRAMSASPGFNPDHLLTGEMLLTWKKYGTEPERLAFADRLLEAIARQPGVVAVGAITNLPFSGNGATSAVTVKGFAPPAGESVRAHYASGVTGEYFRAAGISLVDGRLIDAVDSHRSERVCVVDEDFARRYWGNRSAIGEQVFNGSNETSEPFTVVGVVRAVKQQELTENAAQGAVYFPYAYRNDAELSLAVRLAQTPEAFAATLRSLVRQIDPDLPINHLQAMQTRIDDSLRARRSPALLAGCFAALALVLAGIGTYGVLSFAVAQHRREIGIRMALGAQRQQIGARFLEMGLRLFAAGLLLGIAGALVAGRVMQSLLYDVSVHLTIFAGTGVIMGAVCLTACCLPAMRAARLDPIEALRTE